MTVTLQSSRCTTCHLSQLTATLLPLVTAQIHLEALLHRLPAPIRVVPVPLSQFRPPIPPYRQNHLAASAKLTQRRFYWLQGRGVGRSTHM